MPSTTPDQARARLNAAGQGHVLNFWDRLGPAQKEALLAQINQIDAESLPRLVETYVRHKPVASLPPNVEPAPYYPAASAGAHHVAGQPPATRPWNPKAMRDAGDALVRAGKVACFTVAGGQGSRLGFDGPKGCYPAGAITGKPLFAFFAEGILAAQRRAGLGSDRPVHWAIMTSPLNHDATVAFFGSHNHFGLSPGQVSFFPQGVMPSFDRATGTLLMSAPGEIATSPDGHGGSITALHRSGVLARLADLGVEHVSYFQVDNPVVRVVDPVFLGLHAAGADSSGEMSSKMVRKTYPEEKVGLFCSVGGRIQVIEYSDLPMERQRETLPDGSLRFLAGSIAVHAMSVEFLRRLNEDSSFDLPWHRADKKIPCIDPATGAPIDPKEPNGVKLERFVFDALPMCRASIVLETIRREEFAPIKNAEGVDSPASSARIQTERAASWLEQAGVKIPRNARGEPDCTIELSPLTACEPADLERPEIRKRLPARIGSGERVAL